MVPGIHHSQKKKMPFQQSFSEESFSQLIQSTHKILILSDLTCLRQQSGWFKTSILAIIEARMMKNRPLSIRGQVSGGMKMIKYVHCIVVETRVCERIQSEDTETLDGEPYPRHGIPNNTYQMQSNCHFQKSTTMNFRG
jgi:hypothetical protein